MNSPLFYSAGLVPFLLGQGGCGALLAVQERSSETDDGSLGDATAPAHEGGSESGPGDAGQEDGSVDGGDAGAEDAGDGSVSPLADARVPCVCGDDGTCIGIANEGCGCAIGQPCSDNNPCTINDTCTAGSCVGTAVECVALDVCHNVGECVRTTGICTNPVADPGHACTNGTCQNGSCVQLDITGLPFVASQNLVASGPMATVTDGNPSDTSAELTATIGWGDGSSPSNGTVTGSAGAFTIGGSHTYVSTGAFTVTVTVTPSGGAPASATFTATVRTYVAGASVLETPLPSGRAPAYLTPGPDGALWFGEAAGYIGRITPNGVITEFPVPTKSSGLFGIMAGPDGNLWFTENMASRVGHLVP